MTRTRFATFQDNGPLHNPTLAVLRDLLAVVQAGLARTASSPGSPGPVGPTFSSLAHGHRSIYSSAVHPMSSKALATGPGRWVGEVTGVLWDEHGAPKERGVARVY